MSNSQRIGRVAVIAVHGVADQQPSESAEALGTILLTVEGTGTEGLSAYEPFQSRVIHVPLEPALAPPCVEPKRASARKWDAAYDDGLAFMRKLLGRYKPVGKRSYLTNRLEGRRRKHPAADAPSAGCEVDIYEMYWADLSRLGTDPLRVFGSIYHLLLHLSELGLLALKGGFEEFHNKRWRVLVNLHRVAVKLLTLWIPILNLLALFTLAGAILVRVVGGSVTRSLEKPTEDLAAPLAIDETSFSNSTALKVAAVVGITVLIVGVTYAAASRWLPAKFRGWWLVPVGALTATAALGWVLLRRTQHADIVLVFECWIVGFVLFDFLLRKYEGVIHRARRVGWGLYALVFGAFIWALVVASKDGRFHPREVEYASLWTLQMLNVALSAGWIVLVVFAVLAALLGQWIVRSLKDAECARARAAVRTSRLSLGISASGMIGIVAILFSGLLAWVIARVAAFECMETKVFPPLFRHEWILSHPDALLRWLGPSAGAVSCPGVPYPVHVYLREILLMGTTTGFPLGLALVGLCLLLLVWMALPSVAFESDSPSECTNRQSQRAGEWLSSGLDATKIVARLWWTSVFVVLIVFAVGDFAQRHGRLSQMPALEALFRSSAHISFPLLNQAGTLIAASFALIVFVVVKLAGSALDVVLDVDNYLREEPRESAPRARIAERYVSLLRYVGNRSNAETGRHAYDSVIIVAHSLGALISCDLLRYLKSEADAGRGDPALAPLGFHRPNEKATIPIHLFTMGNPLRQLLNRFFPHQYLWVRSTPDNSMSGVAERTESRDAAGALTPSPEELGVAEWLNAYRSGDYVGRAIWSNDWYARTSTGPDEGAYPEPIKEKPYGTAKEICIGLGAHTHYWDDTARDIRDKLDQMIRATCPAPSASEASVKKL